MAILGNRNSLLEDDLDEEKGYRIPVVVTRPEDGMSFKKSVILSAILHPTVAGLIWLIIFILALMGITFSVFQRPQPKVNDIEFVLVDKQQTPLNKKTHFRSDMNSRTGGKRDPKRKVSMPSPTPTKRSVQHKSAPSQKAQSKVQPKHKVQPQPMKNILKALTKAPTPAPKAAPKASRPGPEARPQPPTPRPPDRPSLRPPSVPRLSAQKPQFAIPVAKPTGAPTGRSYSSGPIGGHGSAKSSGGGSVGGSSTGGGHYAPTPSLSPTRGSGSGSGSSGSKMSHGSSGSGNAGNPGGGGGRPGIDAVREPDFGPYMRELQRRIKMNWDPPKGNESKRVVLLFKIAKDGRLLSLKVFKSSGIPSADKAALSAVELTAPFRPLPGDFRGKSIDIQFTFDYNVFGASGY